MVRPPQLSSQAQLEGMQQGGVQLTVRWSISCSQPINPPPAGAPPSTAPGLHLIGVGCGGNRRGGIGTEQQGIEPGFDIGEPFVFFLQPLDVVLDQLRSPLALLLLPLELALSNPALSLSPLALELFDLRIDGWMPV